MGKKLMKKSLHEKSIVKSCITSIFMASPFLIPAAPIMLAASTANAAVISSVSVRGNQVIPSETIRDFAGVNFGTNLSSADLNDIFHRLSDSGMFEDVELTVSGSTLVITVVENPSVSIVAIEGNKSIKDENLLPLIVSSPRRPYNRLTAEADAQTIAEMYSQEGRVGVTVRPVTIPVAEGRVNLVFEVTETPVSGVDTVGFVGNTAFSDRRLRGIVETNESNVLSFLFGGNTVDAGRVARDQQKLAKYYTNKGYIDFEVLSAVPELSADRGSYTLTYTVNEGFKYDFGTTTVSSSINGVSTDAFERFVNIREGKTYSADDVRDVVEDIEAEAVRQGLPFLRVAPNFTKSPDGRVVDVNFELVNGSRVYVERIDIGGNTSTVERVIRRQFDFVEGDPFNARKMQEAADNLRSLGIFGSTSAVVREGSSPDKVIVDVDVQETSTGSFGFALGYSSDIGINGSITLSDRNFLGRGQSYDFELSVGERSQVFSLSFTEPALFDRDLSAGVDIYYRQVDRPESSFQTTNIGFEPTVGFALDRNTRMGVSYRISSDEIRDSATNASPVIIAEEGTLLTSSIGVTLSHDRRNSKVSPTGGYLLSFEGEYAGLGGNVSYTKTNMRAKGYAGLFDDSVILSLEVEGGALISIDGGSRITDRFFLGGQSLRGFATGGIGPRDMSTTAEDSLGGNFYAVTRVQGSFPLGLPEEYGIFGGIFAEAGSVWSLNNVAGIDDGMHIRASTGLSLFWATPIGPLEFSYAFPILYEANDVTQNFSVSISTRF